jgi:putative membrane protein
MNTQQFLTSAWRWNPPLLLACGAGLIAYFAAFGFTKRAWFFFAALAALLLTLCSPLNALADGYLFSAHMTQHILLLLLVPALLLRSLPEKFSPGRFFQKLANPPGCWLCGVGAMWLWHAPALCNAAVSSREVSALQTVSLLALGSAFWWQILAPNEAHRLSPVAAIVYLFSACLGCTALGIVITFSPVTVCSIYAQPVDRLGFLNTIRENWGMSHQRDQQIGGLLMWVPMCLIYMSAIFAQFARWHRGASEPALARANVTATQPTKF